MIRELNINDIDKFLYLGNLIKSDFSKTNDLKKIIDSDSEEVYGYFINDELVGFIYITKTIDSIDIVDIVVDEKNRRKGIASLLINYVVDNNKDINSIFLEVNEHNEGAIKTYNKNGFETVSIRKKYYGNDDAIVMKRDV
jgi:ribosomal-protein-alanine N-acetyltransferase